jgi:uncharacterized membrane protein
MESSEKNKFKWKIIGLLTCIFISVLVAIPLGLIPLYIKGKN